MRVKTGTVMTGAERNRLAIGAPDPKPSRPDMGRFGQTSRTTGDGAGQSAEPAEVRQILQLVQPARLLQADLPQWCVAFHLAERSFMAIHCRWNFCAIIFACM